MDNFLEKVASQLEKAADYIEKHENEELAAKEKEAQEKKAQEDKERSELVAPVKEKLSSLVEDENIEDVLKNTPMDALKLIKKSFEEKKASEAKENWGKVEEKKVSDSKDKFAGYRDPLEAFAMTGN